MINGMGSLDIESGNNAEKEFAETKLNSIFKGIWKKKQYSFDLG